MESEKAEKYKRCWGVLRKVLVEKKYRPAQSLRFLELLTKERQEESCVKYSFLEKEWVTIKVPPSEMTLSQLTEFNTNYKENNIDSTGVISLWPSEEVLAYFLLQNRTEFQGESFCELGAGFSGLASMILLRALLSEDRPAGDYLITDGNEEAAKMLRENFMNDEMIRKKCDIGAPIGGMKQKPTVEVGILFWSKDFKSEKKFRRIAIADCLFFDEAHESLIHVIDELIDKKSDSSYCLIVGPKRGKTQESFLNKASKVFSIEFLEFKDPNYKLAVENLQKHPDFDADKQLPHFMKLKAI